MLPIEVINVSWEEDVVTAAQKQNGAVEADVRQYGIGESFAAQIIVHRRDGHCAINEQPALE